MKSVKMNIRALASVALLCMTATLCLAKNSVFYKEINAIGGYSEEEDWLGQKDMHLKNSVGFEWFKKYSTDFGDVLTSDLQARLSYNSLDNPDYNWAIEIHNAWLEYKISLGKNLRLGHFSPAFGLEPNTDTHSTLFQTLAGRNIGYKHDWGIGYKSSLGPFDYSIAGQIGSGMGIEQKDGSHLATGRIGNPPGKNIEYGLSLLFGEVLESMEKRTIPQPTYSDEAISKSRIGADAKYMFGPFLIMGEACAGRDEDADVLGALLEVDYTVPTLQTLTFNTQCQFWTDDPGASDRTSSEIGAGASWNFCAPLTLRAGLFHELEDPDKNEDTRIFLQLYYFSK